MTGILGFAPSAWLAEGDFIVISIIIIIVIIIIIITIIIIVIVNVW